MINLLIHLSEFSVEFNRCLAGIFGIPRLYGSHKWIPKIGSDKRFYHPTVSPCWGCPSLWRTHQWLSYPVHSASCWSPALDINTHKLSSTDLDHWCSVGKIWGMIVHITIHGRIHMTGSHFRKTPETLRNTHLLDIRTWKMASRR